MDEVIERHADVITSTISQQQCNGYGIEYTQYPSTSTLHFGPETSRIMVITSSFAHLDVGHTFVIASRADPLSTRDTCFAVLFSYFLFFSLPVFDCVDKSTSGEVNMGVRGDWLECYHGYVERHARFYLANYLWLAHRQSKCGDTQWSAASGEVFLHGFISFFFLNAL